MWNFSFFLKKRISHYAFEVASLPGSLFLCVKNKLINAGMLLYLFPFCMQQFSSACFGLVKDIARDQKFLVRLWPRAHLHINTSLHGTAGKSFVANSKGGRCTPSTYIWIVKMCCRVTLDPSKSLSLSFSCPLESFFTNPLPPLSLFLLWSQIPQILYNLTSFQNILFNILFSYSLLISFFSFLFFKVHILFTHRKKKLWKENFNKIFRFCIF